MSDKEPYANYLLLEIPRKGKTCNGWSDSWYIDPAWDLK
jgi:hypothetical protein